MEGLPEPKAPVVKFELTEMNRVEFDAKLKGRRVGATSHPLVQTEYPMWCIRGALISKTEDLSDPSNFRNGVES